MSRGARQSAEVKEALRLVANGVKPAAAARMTGVSPGRLSQVASERTNRPKATRAQIEEAWALVRNEGYSKTRAAEALDIHRSNLNEGKKKC